MSAIIIEKKKLGQYDSLDDSSSCHKLWLSQTLMPSELGIRVSMTHLSLVSKYDSSMLVFIGTRDRLIKW